MTSFQVTWLKALVLRYLVKNPLKLCQCGTLKNTHGVHSNWILSFQ
ncbi:hypothetical protein [Erwinia phage COW86c]